MFRALLASAEPSTKLKSGATIMCCGSMAMQNAVLDMLEKIAKEELSSSLSALGQKEQLKMDCY